MQEPLRLRFSPLAALLGLALVLVACGTPPPQADPKPEPEPDPATLTQLSSLTALPGDVLVATGTGFGASGSVTVGGVGAPVVKWSDGSVEFVLPNGVGPAWQPVILHPDGAPEAAAELFVGVGYDGDFTDVQEYLDALAQGTHVLLPGGEHRPQLERPELAVPGVHLHGAREGTSLDFGAAGVQTVIGQAPALSLNDLVIHADRLHYRAAVAGAHTGSIGWVNTQVSLHGVEFQGRQSGDEPMAPELTVAGDLKVVNSVIRTDEYASLVGHPNVLVEGSTVEGPAVRVASPHGDATVNGSLLLGRTSTAVEAAYKTAVNDSTVRATNGPVHPVSLPSMPGGLQSPELRVTGSVVEALYSPGEAGANRSIHVQAIGGPIIFAANERIHAYSGVHMMLSDIPLLQLVDNAMISAGRFSGDEGGPWSSGQVYIPLQSNEAFEVEVSGNQFLVEYELFIGAESVSTASDPDGAGNQFTFTDNVVRSSGVRQAQLNLWAKGELDTRCVFTGNVMELLPHEDNLGAYMGCEPTGASLSLTFADNELDLSGASSRLAIRSAGVGESDITGNALAVGREFTLDIPEGALLVTDNQISAARIDLLRSPNVPADATFSGNQVEAPQVEAAMLHLSGRGRIVVADNTFQQLAAVPTAAPAVSVVPLLGFMKLEMSGNTFTNFSHALNFLAVATSGNSEIHDNHFDIDPSAPGAALNASASALGHLAIDISGNRWRGVTTPEQLTPLIYVTRSSSTVALSHERVLQP